MFIWTIYKIKYIKKANHKSNSSGNFLMQCLQPGPQNLYFVINGNNTATKTSLKIKFFKATLINAFILTMDQITWNVKGVI